MITDVQPHAKDTILLGKQKPNAPRHQASFWTKYTFSQIFLKHLGVVIGANILSERFTELLSLQKIDVQILPLYYLLNTSFYYTMHHFRLQLNINNILNRTYWVDAYSGLRLFPGSPRHFLFTLIYQF